MIRAKTAQADNWTGPEVFTLDNYREDLSAVLDVERGDIPDHDQMEVYRTQPVRQYARRAL